MDLTLTDEQSLLAETARAFVNRWSPREGLAAWQSMGQLGWAGLALPERYGGSGRGMLELALVCEQLGRGPMSSPLVVSVTLAALPILWLGTDAQRERFLPALATGQHAGTLAIVEPGMHDEWDAVRMRGEDTLTGTKILVPWAESADVLLAATTDGLYVAASPGPGLHISAHDALGDEPLAAVLFDGCTAELLGSPAADWRAVVGRAVDHATVASVAYTVGVLERMLELSVQYAKDRHQFDRPIGSFQAVAHRCADMRADVDACRYLAYQAAWALDQVELADAQVAVAKAYASDAARRVAVHAHQVHGAIGFSTEYDLHRFTRRAKAFELTYGAAGRHRERLAATMGLRA
jgi:alkylation response protein AidB-like acyl-CoA dehydrogenase